MGERDREMGERVAKVDGQRQIIESKREKMSVVIGQRFGFFLLFRLVCP